MKKQPHVDVSWAHDTAQPRTEARFLNGKPFSTFSYAAHPQDKAPYAIAEDHPEEIPRPNAYYLALDRLLEALEDLLQGDYPLSDELRQLLSNPSLEALIFDEMNKSLKSK